MSNFAPSDPLHTVLSQLLHDRQQTERHKAQSSQVCAFCQKRCGQPDIRSCAEMSGGRPALKKAIRQMNEDLERGIRDDARLNRLYEAYQNVSALVGARLMVVAKVGDGCVRREEWSRRHLYHLSIISSIKV